MHLAVCFALAHASRGARAQSSPVRIATTCPDLRLEARTLGRTDGLTDTPSPLLHVRVCVCWHCSDVNGNDTNPVFKLLKHQKKGYLGERIMWNFTKFLVDRKGQVYSRYAPTTSPDSIKADVEKLLAQPAE